MSHACMRSTHRLQADRDTLLTSHDKNLSLAGFNSIVRLHSPTNANLGQRTALASPVTQCHLLNAIIWYLFPFLAGISAFRSCWPHPVSFLDASLHAIGKGSSQLSLTDLPPEKERSYVSSTSGRAISGDLSWGHLTITCPSGFRSVWGQKDTILGLVQVFRLLRSRG